ncbi:MAG TPA: hypothetical protein PLF26_02560, partial [Blastocatellia bacterium]|nr:hypothetical protein [Blastocatellia bacterium]
RVAGPASDIYTLGVIVYEMLGGRTPFEGDQQTLLHKHAHEEPKALDAVAPGVPRRVSDVVMASLAKDPAARPATAGLFAAALRAKAESWRVLLRQAVTVCADHYPLFLRISFLALLPYLMVRVVDLANFGLEASGAVSHVVTGLTVIPLLFLALVTSFLASVVSRGVATLVLAQLLLAPLSKARVRLAVSAIRPRLVTIARGAVAGFVVVIGPLIVAFIAFGFTIFFGGMMFELVDEQWVRPAWAAVLCVIAAGVTVPLAWYALRQLVRYQLFPVVLLVEDLGVRAGLRRSRELAHRSMRDVASVTVVTFLPLLFSSVVTSTLYALTGLTAGSVPARLVDLFASAPIVILADPFVSVMTGLLYLKLRRAEGERVEDILNRQFADQEAPQRRWQVILSSGSLSQSSPVRSDGGRANSSE